MKLLTKLATLARTLIPQHKSQPGTPTSVKPPEPPPQPAIATSQIAQEGDAQTPVEALEQVRVADLLRHEIGTNKEKGE
ncbi:MAG: hypothetical protein JW934_11175 [Anaerolineae bacterium]|nr:hypothetical protein [Anaerolineae bacterium]